MNTPQTIAALALGLTFAGSAMAQAYPHQECWVENVVVPALPQGRSNTGAVIGGVAGGIIGNQVGGGRGRNAATVAGAVLGAVTGERMDNPQQPAQYATQQVQRCRMVSDVKQKLSGYNVTYRYGGNDVDAFGKPYSNMDERGYYVDGMLVPWGCTPTNGSNGGWYDCSKRGVK